MRLDLRLQGAVGSPLSPLRRPQRGGTLAAGLGHEDSQHLEPWLFQEAPCWCFSLKTLLACWVAPKGQDKARFLQRAARWQSLLAFQLKTRSD